MRARDRCRDVVYLYEPGVDSVTAELRTTPKRTNISRWQHLDYVCLTATFRIFVLTRGRTFEGNSSKIL